MENQIEGLSLRLRLAKLADGVERPFYVKRGSCDAELKREYQY